MAVDMRISPCGCVRVIYDRLYLGYGNLIPLEMINVEKVTFGITDYTIQKIFEQKDVDFIQYFNSTFVQQNSPQNVYFRGEFGFDDLGFYYTNPEQFTTAEIIMNYGLKQLVFKIGSPPTTTLETPFTASYSNGITEISRQELFNMQEVQVRVGNTDSEPIVGSGHTYISIDPLFALNGKIEFPYELYDTYVYVTLTQKPA